VATLFAAATALYSFLWMHQARFPGYSVELGFNHIFNEPYNPETRCIDVKDVVPGSPAERAGLRPGDQIIAVNGKPLTTSLPYDEAYSQGRPGDPVTLTVARAGAKEPIVVHAIFRAAVRSTHEGLAKDSAQQVTRSYPLPFFLVGFAVLFLRLQDRSAWLLALLFTAFVATPTSTSLAVIPQPLVPFFTIFQVLFGGMLCPLFYIFFAVFPLRSPLDRVVPWVKWVALAFGAALVIPGLWIGDMRIPGIAARLVGDRFAGPVRGFFVYGSYLLLALGLASLLGNALTTTDHESRRKSRVILWGTILGVFPIALERFVIDFFGYQPSFWVDSVLIVILLLYPLSFAYAVVKHRVMEIPALLRRSARYVLVQRGFFVLLFAAAALAIALFTHTFARFFPQDGNLGMALSAVFGIALVWVSAPVVKRGTERIDKAFFRSAYDARVILQDLAEKTRAVTNRHELATLLGHQIQGALHPKSFACYLQSPGGSLVSEFGQSPAEPALNSSAMPRPQFPARFGARFVVKELNALPPSLPFLAELAERAKAWDVPPPVAAELGAFGPLAPECLVPILGRSTGLIGLLALGPRLSEEPYSGEDKHLLDSVASQAGITLENIAFAEKMAERMEAERAAAMEMDIARRVQARLFPQKLPLLRTLEYIGGCVQARQVGGDYYDFLDMGPGVLGIVLADISGKGMSGALLMANLQANLRSQYAVALDDLPRLLQSVNRLFYENSTDESYATMFFGVYDDASRTLRYANCGHVPPLLLHPDASLQRLNSTTTVLGLFPKWDCPIEEVQLQSGDLLVICTDGVTEAPDANGDEFGADRLADLLRHNSGLPVCELLASIQSAVQQFSSSQPSPQLHAQFSTQSHPQFPAQAPTQADDITLILARSR
jgi:sigma-B regulation protein RsbU (phosphoserine phosphatase)